MRLTFNPAAFDTIALPISVRFTFYNAGKFEIEEDVLIMPDVCEIFDPPSYVTLTFYVVGKFETLEETF